VKQHWVEDYGLVKAILMELSTPEVLIGFPVLALWYWLAGPNPPQNPTDKTSN
jgi:hypothetical protein